MDTGPVYYSQCYRAQEIQNIWRMEEGDFIGIRFLENDMKIIVLSEENYSVYRNLKEKLIWLPRQDQLQKMLAYHDGRGRRTDKALLPTDFIYYFNTAIEREMVNPEFHETMEQLTLAFVMQNYYNKYWIYGDWKTIPEQERKIYLKAQEWSKEQYQKYLGRTMNGK